jgi:hypothetical protein
MGETVEWKKLGAENLVSDSLLLSYSKKKETDKMWNINFHNGFVRKLETIFFCFSWSKSHVRVPLNNFQSKTAADKESHSTWSGRRKSLIKTEEGDDNHLVSIHCKKGYSFSPAGMSLTKLSLARTSRLGTGKTIAFLQSRYMLSIIVELKNVKNRQSCRIYIW